MPKLVIRKPAATAIEIPSVITDDSLKILPTLQDKSAQIIIADPPYNISERISEMIVTSSQCPNIWNGPTAG